MAVHYFHVGQEVEFRVEDLAITGTVRAVTRTDVIIEPDEKDISRQILPVGAQGMLLFASLDATYSMPTNVVGLGPRRFFIRRNESKIAALQRRQFFRVRLSVRLAYAEHTLGQAPNQSATEQQGYTRDISAGGVLLEVPKPLAVGTILRIQLHIDDDPVELRGRVVRTFREGKQALAGIEFIRPGEQQKGRITHFLYQYEPRVVGWTDSLAAARRGTSMGYPALPAGQSAALRGTSTGFPAVGTPAAPAPAPQPRPTGPRYSDGRLVPEGALVQLQLAGGQWITAQLKDVSTEPRLVITLADAREPIDVRLPDGVSLRAPDTYNRP